MAQEYKVVQFKKGDFQDNYGNWWCDMVLEGFGEPVKIVVKDPMQFEDGMTLYGSIEQKTSKAGKQYNRFKREQKPDTEEKEAYWQEKNMSIRAQWAIGQAVSVHADNIEKVETLANELFEMVDRVSGNVEQARDQEEKVASEVVHEVDDQPINLDDIPF